MIYNTMFMQLRKDTKLNKKLTQYENNIEYMNYFMLLENLALDTFEWEGLPETCDERMIEANLLYRGTACLYRDKDGVIWSYGAGIGGMLTKYGYPDRGTYYALNGVQGMCKYYWPFMDNTEADAVLCLDNKLAYPFINYVERGAYIVSDAKRALQTAARNNKYSYILQCNEEQAKSMRNIYNDVQNNEIAVIVSKDNFEAPAQVFNTNIRNGIIQEMWEYYMNVYDDVKDVLGINSNKQSDKKERLINAEVMGDAEFVSNNLAYRLKERELFCERCNEFFGLNMSVKLKNKEDNNIFMDEQDPEQEADNENETV